MTDDELQRAIETGGALAFLAQLIPAADMFAAIRTERARARAEGASVAQVAMLDEQLNLFDLIEQLGTSADRLKALAAAADAQVVELVGPAETETGWPDEWVRPAPK